MTGVQTCALPISFEQTGACCVGGDACLMNMTEMDCNNQSGLWQGPNTTSCTNCPPTGACCVGVDTCLMDVTESFCSGQSGDWQGDGSTNCVNCPPETTGACCFVDENNIPVSCNESLTETECLANSNGRFQGVGSTCADDCMTGVSIPCCFSSDCQQTLTREICMEMGGTPVDGTSCETVSCPEDCIFPPPPLDAQFGCFCGASASALLIPLCTLYGMKRARQQRQRRAR